MIIFMKVGSMYEKKNEFEASENAVTWGRMILCLNEYEFYTKRVLCCLLKCKINKIPTKILNLIE